MKNNAVRLLVAFFLMVGAIACHGGEEQEGRKNGFSDELKTHEDSLFHDIMEGHDVAMVRMNVISNYLEKTKKALDSLQKLPIEKVDVLYQQDLIDLQEDLNYAQYSMNTWMDEFKVDSNKNDKALREQYLEKEKEKVIKMKEAVLSSLQRADSLFNKQ